MQKNFASNSQKKAEFKIKELNIHLRQLREVIKKCDICNRERGGVCAEFCHTKKRNLPERVFYATKSLFCHTCFKVFARIL